MRSTRLLAPLVVAGALLAACGGDDDSAAETEVPAAEADAADSSAAASVEAPAGITLVSPADAEAFLADAPDDVVILDVRTPEEFAEGHIEGAVNIDIYEPTFADDIDALERDVPYVVYCRSGNRSGQATTLMADLGFESVQDVDGGVVSWSEAGLPLVAG
jgi:rhodanese-related sulfurtransferase